jgi:type III secretory pathway component EscV
MTKELDLDTYLIITNYKFVICLFNKKNFKSIYIQEFEFKNNTGAIDFNSLSKFLENNIFKIEKLTSKFINNIIVVIDNEEIKDLNIGIKKKNYIENLNSKNLESLIVEAKDLFEETYQDQKIIHIIIQNYLINGKTYYQFQKNFQTNDFGLEIKFISVSNKLSHHLEKVLEKYQIKISKYVSWTYVENYFKGKRNEFPVTVYEIINGINENEVNLVPKNTINKGFFEKFFQLFS